MKKIPPKNYIQFLSLFILIDCIQSAFSIFDYLSNPEMLITPLLKLSGFAPLIMRISFFQLKSLIAFNIATCIVFAFFLFKLVMAVFILFNKKIAGFGVLVSYFIDLFSLIYFYSTTQFINELYSTSILLLATSILYDLFFMFLAIIYIKTVKERQSRDG